MTTKNINIEVEGTFYGKIATSKIEIINNLFLDITTAKRFDKNIKTCFSLWYDKGGGISESAGGAKSVYVNHGKFRSTEKKLVELHRKAIDEQSKYIENIKLETIST